MTKLKITSKNYIKKKENIMNRNIKRITLHHAETYQIKVPGVLDALWFDDDSSLSISVEEIDDGQLISILTGSMDQAALQGLLRLLYSLGLPLISVNCVKNE